jgi:FtsP/CotA-like multicopper oxidase with cupredoxin domain
MPLYVVARDGHPLTQSQKLSEFFVGPGELIDAIAVGPKPGEYAMTTIPFQDQAWRKSFPAQQLATVISSGSKGSMDHDAEILRQRVEGEAWIEEVRTAPIARRRVLTYSRTPDRKVFMIDGRIMEEDRVDQTVHLGDTEEWTIVNTDQQYHSFHIHQTGFLVTEVNGVSQNDLGLRDTFSLPPDTDTGRGVMKVVIA